MSSPKADLIIKASNDLDGTQDTQDSGAHLSSSNTAPDQFDAKFETSKYELWAYYTYYIGNSGLFLYQWAPLAFQNVSAQAAGESGLLRFLGR